MKQKTGHMLKTKPWPTGCSLSGVLVLVWILIPQSKGLKIRGIEKCEVTVDVLIWINVCTIRPTPWPGCALAVIQFVRGHPEQYKHSFSPVSPQKTFLALCFSVTDVSVPSESISNGMAHIVPADHLLIASEQDYIAHQPPVFHNMKFLSTNSCGLAGRGLKVAAILFSIVRGISLQTLLSPDCWRWL